MVKASSSVDRGKLLAHLQVTMLALQRARSATRRLQASLARRDTRSWQVTRRERTRQLIELGGLVAKAGLVTLTGDDRALLLGAFLAVADRLAGEDGARFAEHWRERGRQAFAADDASQNR